MLTKKKDHAEVNGLKARILGVDLTLAFSPKYVKNYAFPLYFIFTKIPFFSRTRWCQADVYYELLELFPSCAFSYPNMVQRHG